MTTSPTTNNNRISRGDLAYICRRNQHNMYNLLVKAIKESGLTQKQLSELTSIDEASISRLLRRPRNVQLDTLSKLVYAASKAAISFTHSFPASRTKLIFQAKGNLEKMDTSNVAPLIQVEPETKTKSSGDAEPIVARGELEDMGQGLSSEDPAAQEFAHA